MAALLSLYDYAAEGSHAVKILNAVKKGEVLREKVTSIYPACDILQIGRIGIWLIYI